MLYFPARQNDVEAELEGELLIGVGAFPDGNTEADGLEVEEIGGADADIDMAAFPGPPPPNLPLFTRIGLVDAQFKPKPALAAWDGVFARKWAGRR